jgi:hypothetical protein
MMKMACTITLLSQETNMAILYVSHRIEPNIIPKTIFELTPDCRRFNRKKLELKMKNFLYTRIVLYALNLFLVLETRIEMIAANTHAVKV